MKRLIALCCLVLGLTSEAQQPSVYANPILSGFYPDPSICRVGDDYYIVNSTFAYYPGLPIFHSKDLVSWKQIGYAMNRPEQLPLQGAGVSRGLFAPTIRYYKGLFYILCTLIDKGGNFIITAKDPKGLWSNPIWLKNVDGIDPSLFFDEKNDKAYIIYNSIAPDNKPLWDGHRTIRMRSFDYHTFKASDDELLLVNGGTDISKKPVWIEGPHIYLINGWYYLMCAEGGTGYNHSEVIFRSKSVTGPYESYEHNPILTQRQLDPGRKNPVTTAGHADLVDTRDGQWYAVFLGCRPYESDYYNTGRETFLAPVHWDNGWPWITKGNEEVSYYYPVPTIARGKMIDNAFSGNVRYQNGFDDKVLDQRFIFLRTLTQPWYSTTEKKGYLRLAVRPETVSGTDNPSFVGFRQQNLKCTATTALQFHPGSAHEKAGLIIFQSEHHFYFICRSMDNKQPVVQLYQSTNGEEINLLASQVLTSEQDIYLRIRANDDHYSFDYSNDNKRWTILKADLDGKFLSTKVAGGFVGSLFGLYATSHGQATTSTAYFNWFDYNGSDVIYQQKPFH